MTRPVVVLGLAVLVFVGTAAAAAAQPGPADQIPPALRHYVIDSMEWRQSPWMTARDCASRGGDFSVYADHMIKDLPALLAHHQPDFSGKDKHKDARREALTQGFRAIAAEVDAPPGFCVDTLRAWARPNPAFRPFGFEWGVPDDPGRRMSTTSCVRSDVPDDVTGACRGFYVSCARATTQQDDARCQQWNAFADEHAGRMKSLYNDVYATFPGTGAVCDPGQECGIDTEIKSPGELAQEFLTWVAKEGMEQLVSFVVAGVTQLWQVFATIAGDARTGPSLAYPSAAPGASDRTGPSNAFLPDLTGPAFSGVYNLVAGVAVALGFLLWVATVATGWRRGHLQYSVFGAIKALAGVTLAAVGAIFMLQLAGECTAALLAAGGGLDQADFTASLIKANPLVALLAGLVMAICLIFGIIFLTVHAALVLCWALFGPLAAIGQVNPATSDWLPRWASRGTAFAWAPFAMIAVMLLAKELFLPVEEGDDSSYVINVVIGTVMVALMVLAPYLLWELIDFVSGRAGVGSGGATASHWAGKGAARTARAARGAGGRALGTMLSSGADIARQMRSPAAQPAAAGASGSTAAAARPARTAPKPGSGTAAKPAPPHPTNPPPGGGPTPPRTDPAGAPTPAANRGSVVARGFGGAAPRPSGTSAAPGPPAPASGPSTPPRPPAAPRKPPPKPPTS